MRITILTIGKSSRGPEQSLWDEYIRRLPWPVEIREYELKKQPASSGERKKLEGEKLLEALDASAVVIALDERGKTLSSREFANKIDGWRMDGIRDLLFVIGGADGLSDAVRDRANLLLSFGKLTWPHMLVRVMLCEQIYRAWSIGTNHPYHRD